MIVPMMNQEQYYMMWDKYITGEITVDAWTNFCMEVLSEILCEPEVQAVMQRLKYR